MDAAATVNREPTSLQESLTTVLFEDRKQKLLQKLPSYIVVDEHMEQRIIEHELPVVTTLVANYANVLCFDALGSDATQMPESHLKKRHLIVFRKCVCRLKELVQCSTRASEWY